MALVNVGTSPESVAAAADSICRIIRTAYECHCSESVQERALMSFTESVKVHDVSFDKCTFSTGQDHIGS